MKQRRLIMAGIILLGVLCYANSFTVPFIFDDDCSIKYNPSICVLWPLYVPLSPHIAEAVQARPLVNFTLALNYAIGGLDVRGYHVVNLALHLVAALALFGLVRRTLLSPALGKEYGAMALPLASVIAALWVAHPLNSEAVTYIIQRTESQMGMCYLLTLYCATRSAEQRDARRRCWWSIVTVACCAAGMASKEVMVTAPLIVVLHDRTFFAGSIRRALAQRPCFYLGLLGTWALFGWIVLHFAHQGRGVGAAGFGYGVSSWEYLRTQFGAVAHYLRLAFWPDNLIADYGNDIVGSFRAVLPQALLLGVLMLGTTWLSVRNHPLGFLGAWFFLILLPSSSVVPLVAQTAAEKRMYLSLAAVIAAVIIGVFTCGRRLAARAAIAPHVRLVGVVMAVVAVCAVIAAAATRTLLRNRDYQSYQRILEDVIKRNPSNVRVHYTLGDVLIAEGKPALAAVHYRQVLTHGDYPVCHYSLAGALNAMGMTAEAVTHLARAVALTPSNVHFRLAYAQCLEQDQRLDAAVAQYEQVLQVQPEATVALNNLAWLIANHKEKKWHNMARATALAEKACTLTPGNPSCLDTLAGVYAAVGRFDDAARAGRLALAAATSVGSTGHVSKLKQRLERYLRNEPRLD